MKCVYCEKETENIRYDEYVCSSCVNKLYVRCENCGELHDKEKMTRTDIGYVCSECLEDNFARCYDCGGWIHNDNIRRARRDREGYEVYVCEDCCNQSYMYCVECGEYVKAEEGTVRTYDGQWRCYECLISSEYFICCDGCETYYRECDMTYSESRHEWLCPDCYEEVEEDDTVIQAYHSGHKNGLKFYSLPCESTKLYYGIELEIERKEADWTIDELANEALEKLNSALWHCESDGSLQDGCEFISQPMTFNYLVSQDIHKIIKSALDRLIELGARSYNTSHCGLHFHVSRAGLTPQAIVNLLVMTTRFKDVVFKLSRRTEANFQRWSRAYDEITELTPAIKSSIKDDTIPYSNFDRYCMINLTNRATVEFRFFRGTLNHYSFFGALHFINFLVEYALKCETENDITMSEIEFINQAKNHSSELKNFMEKVGL